MAILVDAQGLGAARPNRPLYRDLSLTVSNGDRIGVVGINGSGKSTFLRMLAGDLDPEAGVVRRGRGARIGFLPQAPVLPADYAAAVQPVAERRAVLAGYRIAEVLRKKFE